MRATAAALVLVLSDIAGWAGTETATPPPSAQPALVGPAWSWDLNSDYVMGSRIAKAGSFGSQAQTRYELEILRNVQLANAYYLQLGLDYETYRFSRSNEVFPDALTSIAAEINLAYWSSDDFFPLIKIAPGLYYTRNRVTQNAFDAPIRAAAGINLTRNFYLIGGASVDFFDSSPVFPVGGFDWRIRNDLNLRAVFPQPRFSYTPSKQLELFVGGELSGGSYRNGPTTDHRTNHALLETEEYRAGAGCSFEPRHGFSV